ncbi:YqzK family protein [Salipaludibacillus keqinensis]|nr:YqzK family protein [Salipaludibacillus keqinensis]
MIWLFFLFMGCTLVFYYGILWVSDEYKEYHRYDEPHGRSMKVISPSNVEEPKEMEAFERLRLFFVEGE